MITLAQYVHDQFQKHENGSNNPLVCDFVNKDTGEVYFSGQITWCVMNFINPELIFVKREGKTILFFDPENTI